MLYLLSNTKVSQFQGQVTHHENILGLQGLGVESSGHEGAGTNRDSLILRV